MRLLLTALCTTLLLAGCAPGGPRQAGSGFAGERFSETTSPGEDLYLYVNGPWLDATEIPPEWSSYGVMQQLYEQSELQMKAIVDAAGDVGRGSTKLAALYNSFMDTELIEQNGLAPLAGELERVEGLQSHDALIGYFGRALARGIQVPVNFYIDTDAANPDVSLAYFWQDGLGLPDREYYLSDNEALVETLQQYVAHIDKLYAAAAWPGGTTAAEVIVELERQIAERQWTRVQNRDRQKIYSNKVSLSDAAQMSPAFAWGNFFANAGFGDPAVFVLAQTDYFTGLGEFVRSVPMNHWRSYLRFKLLKAYAPYLSADIVAEDFDFQRRVLRGQEEIRPRWKRGLRLVNGALGELLGQEYVARHFPPGHKDRIDKLVANLLLAFGESIDQLEWMSADTQDAARDKLSRFSTKVGYPDTWRDYSELEISATDLIGNVRRSRLFEHQHEVGKLSQPVDRDEWGMTPQTVNAYYRPTFNEIVFPAAILQPPFFDPTADDAMNYGAIGAVIGHEISHGFDDQGRKFDGEGRLRDWWTEDDAAEYERRAQVLVEQYSAFRPLPDTPINGRLTLGENIADLAGLMVAHRAYRLSLGDNEAPVLDGLTGDQRFFIGFARAWRGKYRDELLREMLVRGPHSPGKYRVAGVVRNMPAFYAAFDVGEDSPQYLAPAERAAVW